MQFSTVDASLYRQFFWDQGFNNLHGDAPTVYTVAKESRTKRICLVRQVPVLVVASESNQRHNTCWERFWRRKKKAETVIDTAAWLFWARSYHLGATFERELFWDTVFQMLSIPALFLFVSFLVDHRLRFGLAIFFSRFSLTQFFWYIQCQCLFSGSSKFFGILWWRKSRQTGLITAWKCCRSMNMQNYMQDHLTETDNCNGLTRGWLWSRTTKEIPGMQ